MFEVEVRRYDDPDVRQLTDEVQQEYVDLYGGPDAAKLDPAEFEPPNGLFLVGVLEGVPVAMGGWRRSTDGSAELKRMYVRPGARRLGLARSLLAELERTALAAGVERFVLNTGSAQPAAIAMYVAAGYRPSPGFGHYACTPGALFFSRELAGLETS